MRKKICYLLSVEITFVVFLLPTVVEACPKCFAATGKQVLNAYYVSIAFMSFIPLAMIGAVLTWIYRQTHPRRKKQKPI